jgi:putative ABC transport system permease protein
MSVTISGARAPGRPAPTAARLRASDLARLAVVGLRTRKLRAALSALGIGIGAAAIVAVLGLSSSSAAGLNAEIAALGTNLLTVQNGQSLTGANAELPLAAMITRLPGVYQVQSSGATGASVYRSPLIPSVNTNALTVDAATLGLPATAGTSLARGVFLNAATAREPVCVLGAAAAQLLGIDRVFPGERVWVTGTGGNGNGGMWLYVAGILHPDVLSPDVDSSVLVGFGFAEHHLSFDGHPSTIYVKAADSRVNAVYSLLASQADPEDPSGANVSQPSDALVAQADAKSAFSTLFLGLGAVALLVGAIAGRGRRHHHRRRRHRHLRPRQRLGHRHPHRRLGRRPDRRHPHRRPRRTAARHPRRPPVPHPGPVGPVTPIARAGALPAARMPLQAGAGRDGLPAHSCGRCGPPKPVPCQNSSIAADLAFRAHRGQQVGVAQG